MLRKKSGFSIFFLSFLLLFIGILALTSNCSMFYLAKGVFHLSGWNSCRASAKMGGIGLTVIQLFKCVIFVSGHLFD